MSVVTGALGSLAPKLLQLLHDEYKLQKGVKKQVQWLTDELESVSAFLHKVADVPWYRLDEQVKVWARQVREASFDMEDVLDSFLVRFDSSKAADLSRLKHAMKKMSMLLTKAKTRHDIAGAIEDIKKHLEDVAKRRQCYKLDEIMSKQTMTTSTIDPRLTATYKEVNQLIGVNKSRDELVSLLMPSQQDDELSEKNITKKVSIVGVGGLGKTTLAKAVYEKLKIQYDCGAFVSVGRDLDLVKVFKDILFDIDKKKYQNIHNSGRGGDLLIRELRELLENKRYFVVLDDIWDVKTWDRIKVALVENSCGSRVITTTRKFDVANVAGEVYKLQPLSHDNSKKLFYARISAADVNYLDKKPDDITDKILKKCDGIPLAIITMASLLVGKSKDEWSELYNSIGFGYEENREVEDTMTILSFSYYDLPSHLRTCLLYLSTYPEDVVIAKDSLIWKWIAEGFVHGKTTGLFELGERYFTDLINRSMIQAVEDRLDGRVLGCRVHDMVLDLIRKISFEENFIAPLHDNIEGMSSPSIVRRLAHQNKTAEHIDLEAKVIEMKKVRSYTIFKCYINNGGQFLSFKLLRVLDIVECIFKKGCNLEHLGNLLHLRYFGLKRCRDISELPKQIGNLKLLQTLDVVGVQLPASIILLTQLMRLYCAANIVHDGIIGKLTSLQELILISNSYSHEHKRFAKELGSLRELRMLVFSNFGMDDRMQGDFVESIRNLQKIEHIQVHCRLSDANTALWEAGGFILPRPLRFLSLDIYFSKLPSCINSSRLPNLSYLTLYVSAMDEMDLKVLARLPALCFLQLTTMCSVTACNINTGDGGCFQKLRCFKINDAMVQFQRHHGEDSSFSLHIWKGYDAMPFSFRKSNCSNVVPADVMPNLEVLWFDAFLRPLKVGNGDCGSIGLEHLPSLREVRGIIYCDGVSAEEVDAAWAALRNACKVHPNNPTLLMSKCPKPEVKKDKNQQEEAADG